jgi:hypothetical protein
MHQYRHLKNGWKTKITKNLIAMASNFNQEISSGEINQLILSDSAGEKKIPTENSFDPEFSLPFEYFKPDFLNCYEINKPPINK